MKLITWFLRLLYPPKCVFCGKLLNEEETDLCAVCRRELPRCKNSFKRGECYQECFSVYYYEKQVAESVRRFKFCGQSQFADAYGRLMAMLILEKEIDFDLLTWVPLSKRRERDRGYCQTKLIAKSIASELGIETIPLLIKTKDNDAQATLKKFSQRKDNVVGAYRAIHNELFAGKRILLIDDVVTSGATLSECSRTLKNVGAKSITCVTLAATRD
ncbi:MAG: ComF family protein [Ruminococcaceae bacterium]|nr:ComF family protein [Oscillospiraceae bacterium]